MKRISILVLAMLVVLPAIAHAASPRSLLGISMAFDPAQLELRVDGAGEGEYADFNGVLLFAREGMGMIQINQWGTWKPLKTEADMLLETTAGEESLTGDGMLSGRPAGWACVAKIDRTLLEDGGPTEVVTCLHIGPQYTTMAIARTSPGLGKAEEIEAIDAAFASLREP